MTLTRVCTASLLSLGLLGAWASVAQAATGSPVVAMTASGTLHDGQVIGVSVGSNSIFVPHTRVNILECADPGGTKAGLPVNDHTCDGNTAQPDSVIVGADGSFSESSFDVSQLPSAALGEQSNDQPVCDATAPCVLFVGQNQNDFSAPKVFSAPFTVLPALPSGAVGGAAVAAGTPTTPASTSPPASGADPAVALSSGDTPSSGGSLANTGAPSGLLWLSVAGLTMVLAGAIGRRLVWRFTP